MYCTGFARLPSSPPQLFSSPRSPPGLLGEAAPADLQGVDQPPASQTPQSSGERSGSLGGGAAPKTKPRRRGGKKRSKPTVDDLDTLQIRGRVSVGAGLVFGEDKPTGDDFGTLAPEGELCAQLCSG